MISHLLKNLYVALSMKLSTSISIMRSIKRKNLGLTSLEEALQACIQGAGGNSEESVLGGKALPQFTKKINP